MADETSGPIWLARVLAGLGLVLPVWSLFTGFEVGASEAWPTVTGQVIRAEVESAHVGGGGRRSASETV